MNLMSFALNEVHETWLYFKAAIATYAQSIIIKKKMEGNVEGGGQAKKHFIQATI